MRRFATDRGTSPLHVLINNPGIMATPLTRTESGWESQFATNHLGHFALATGLHDALAAVNTTGLTFQSGRLHHQPSWTAHSVSERAAAQPPRAGGPPPHG